MPTIPLELNELRKGMPGVTPIVGAALAEAAAVCLQEMEHSSGIEMKVGGLEQAVQILWPEVDEQAFRAWRDEETATEYGACGIGVMLIKTFTDFTVIEQARKGTGFDYWLGHQEDEAVGVFEQKGRLEISGIRRGTEQEVKRRVREKIQQTNPSDFQGLPAYVSVVEFGTPRAEVVKK